MEVIRITGEEINFLQFSDFDKKIYIYNLYNRTFSYLESLHSDLESVHGPDGCLCTGRIIKADEAEALALVGGPVNEHLGADHVPEGQEHLHQLSVPKLLGQVVDEQVAPLRSTD